MEYVLNREALVTGDLIYDGSQEQPVDLDISLPDYCPDIQRILKCQVYPRITSRNILGDRAELEGSYTVRVLYLDSGGTAVRCCESSSSFLAAITLKQQADQAAIFAGVRVEYINCRATSPRRLDIHGAFSVCARIVSCAENEVVTGISDDEVELRLKTMPYSRVAGMGRQQFSIDEVLELPDSKPGAENILRPEARAVVKDFKIVANKVMLQGDVCVKFLYSSALDENTLETMEYAVPFSQMVDCDGVTEECLCDVRVDVTNLSVQIKNDYSGEQTFFDLQVGLFACAVAYQNTETTLVTDAYSRKFEMNLTYRQKTLEQLAEFLRENAVQKYEISLSEAGIMKVLDVWNEMSSVTAAPEGGQIVFRGKFNVCILALNAEGRPFYLERVVDFEATRAGLPAGETLRCDADVSVSGINYRIMSGGLEIRTELALTAGIYRQSACKSVVEATADEDCPRAQDTAAALSIYYADPGELLWDIARAYCTSVGAIQRENGLDGEVMESRGMLLIPM